MNLTPNTGLPTEIAEWFTIHEADIVEISNSIFATPEIAYEEVQSCKTLKEFIASQGFEISSPIDDMPTAFMATYGSGHPIIGFLAEYDALPNLGQENVSKKKTIEGPGHGCGHNLLGVGSAAAAAALKAYIEKRNIAGTIILYGTPAEEILSGKIIMNQKGLFDQLDIAITWHPFDRNRISNDIWLAHDIKNYRFYGKSSHAAKFPEFGRSALDAAELMNVGVNYLREHVSTDVRMHYAYTSATAPANVVPDFVETNYFIRAATSQTKDDASARVDDCAKGAALMTGTRVEIEYKTGCKEMKINRTLVEIFYTGMEQLETPSYTKEELLFAKNISQEANLLNDGIFFKGLEPLEDTPVILPIGTDVADVSHKIPTITVSGAAMCRGTALHHWATTAQAGMSIGHKGMVYAAKAMVLGATYLFQDSSLIEKCWDEHKK